MYTLKTYKNGLRLIHNHDTTNQSVSVNFMTLVGGKDEDDTNRGIAHFLEHMFFKGTEKRTCKEINAEFDKLGIFVNAYTSKDMTVFYNIGLASQCENMFDILSDCFFHSQFPKEELVLERKVVCSELEMRLDDNKDLMIAKSEELALQGTEYAYPLGGTVESVSKLEREDLINFRNKYYTPDRLVISVSGNVTQEEVEALINKYVLPNCSTEEKTPINYIVDDFGIDIKEKYSFTKRDTDQYYSTISFRGIGIDSEDLTAYRCMIRALGGSMSSRLFRKVREERGLVYTISTFCSDCAKSQNGIIFYCNIDKAEETYKAVREVLEEIRADGFNEDDLSVAKNLRKTSLVLGTIQPAKKALSGGEKLIYNNKLLNIDEELEAIDKITIQDMNNAFTKYFDNKDMTVTVVSKDNKLDPIKILTE